ncbi:hypothetical protein OAV41_02170, partial [Planctomycetota bacterium]|nr:hypothetical protein [Planctomycetota bacterium]
MSIDTSGRVQIKQNNTSVSNYPASGAWTMTGVPDWANKITLGTWRVSQASTGEIRLRVTVGGTAVSTGDIYKYTDGRYLDNTAPVVNSTGIGTGLGA